MSSLCFCALLRGFAYFQGGGVMGPGMDFLSLNQVSLGYQGKLVVQDLNLALEKGQILGLLGPNGSGKSTTIHAITGNHPLASGSITLGNVSLAKDPIRFKRMLGFVPQELAIYEELSAFDNLWFFGKNYGLSSSCLRLRIFETLAMVRLEDHARMEAGKFSGGMKRRLNIACALLHEPALLLLDEPTAGLDTQSREAVFSCLENLRDAGCAVIYTSHYFEEVDRLCDQIGMMRAGSLVFHGSLESFQNMDLVSGKAA